MPLGKTHAVLCVACRMAVSTEYAYPERRCGHTLSVRRAEDDKVIHVSCTNDDGNADCGRGVHYDRYVQLRFGARDALRSGKDGQIGRA